LITSEERIQREKREKRDGREKIKGKRRDLIVAVKLEQIIEFVGGNYN